MPSKYDPSKYDREKARLYYIKNKSKIAAQRKIYYMLNKKKINQYHREYMKKKFNRYGGGIEIMYNRTVSFD